MTHKLIGGQIASFPGLPRFYLLWRLHNTRERKSSENGERSGSIHQVNDVRWTQAGHEGGGGGNCQNNTLDHPFECSTAVLDSRP